MKTIYYPFKTLILTNNEGKTITTIKVFDPINGRALRKNFIGTFKSTEIRVILHKELKKYLWVDSKIIPVFLNANKLKF